MKTTPKLRGVRPIETFIFNYRITRRQNPQVRGLQIICNVDHRYSDQRVFAILFSAIFTNNVNKKGKGKGKVHPITGHEGPEGKQIYSSTLPSTSALDGGGWSTPRPGRFIPWKEPVPIV